MFSAEYRPTADVRRRFLAGTLAGLVGALACFAAARLSGSDLVVDARGSEMPVPIGAVVVASLLGAAAGWALVRLALRRSRPRRSFLLWTAAGLLLSVVPPVQAAVDARTAAWLVAMHVVVAAGLVPPVAGALPTGPAPARRVDRHRSAAETAGP